MKTQVINLESYDDLHSVTDKINWTQADRLILVWPLHGQVLNHKLDLMRLQRHVQTGGGKLALVTRSNAIKSYAAELGVPVFQSLRRAQSVAWEYTLEETEAARPPRPERRPLGEIRKQLGRDTDPSWQDRPRVRGVIFSIALLSAFALLVFFLPAARVEFTPQTKLQELPLTLTTSPLIPTYNLSGAVPSERLTITVEGRDTIPATGNITIPEANAKGVVTFTNLTDNDILIPAGTVITTFEEQPVRFATLVEAEAPAEGGVSNYIPVEAINAGPDANLEIGDIQVIEGNLSLGLTATNPTPTSGGLNRTSRAPAIRDYDALSEQLLAQLWNTALEEARANLDPRDIILESAPGTLSVLEESFTPEEPQPSSDLSLLLRVEYQITVLRYQVLQQMGNDILGATLETGFQAQPETLTIQPQAEPQFNEDGTVVLDVLITRQVYSTAGQAQAFQGILGARPQAAAAMLTQALNLESPPQISIEPAWWPWLPLVEMRIDVQDQE